jgi:AmiR/NasT family two-component response regulator
LDHDSPQIIDNLQELHGLLLSEETLQSTLQRVAELARATIDGCDSAGVTIRTDSKVSTAAATDDFTLKIDHDQYENREGPCLQALSTQQVVSCEDIASDTRWPKFAEAAERDGLGAVLSLPLSVRDLPMGALNLYSKRANSFEENSRPLGKQFARQASVAISNAQVYTSAMQLTEQLKDAIKTREIIGEAKGILIAQEGVSEDEAFDMLKRVSQNQNVKLRDISQKVVDEAVKKSGGSSAPSGTNTERGDRIRVLLVDDVDDLRRLLQIQLLADPRFEVVGQASDGREAIERAAELQPDVILLDVMMPVMDGLQAIPEIHRVAPGSKILMLSAVEDSGTRQNALALSAHAYLEKGMAGRPLVHEIFSAFDAPAKSA